MYILVVQTKKMIKDLKEVFAKFSNEDVCRQYLIQQRWNGKPVCPYCGCDKSYVIEGGKRFKCGNKECYKKYSVTVGTIFHASNIPLTTWFPTMYIISAHKKGISSVQLAKDLGVTQKTAWFMNHRIRQSLKENHPEMLSGTVEVDETYIGGKIPNMNNKKRAQLKAEGKQWRTKPGVMGLLQREGDLKVISIGMTTQGAELRQIIKDNVKPTAQ
jgi:transposase-like protein